MANKKCLVFETMNNISASMQIVESSNPKEIRLTGVFGVAGIKNNNNRIYDKQNYGMMVESLQKVIANEGCLGELEHPNSMNINLNNVSHKIESIEMNEDGTVTGTIVLIDTDKGRNAKAIIEAGVPLYISSRAAGSIDESGHVTLTSLKTYDLVGTPGFSQAKLNLSENQTFESLNESLCVIYENDDSDDLLSSDDDKDGKEDKKDKEEKEKDSNKESNSEDDSKKKEEKKEDNNKNNNDKEATMQDLKEAIDKLSEKIEDLTADLHVAQESLKEKDSEIQNLTEKLDSLDIPKINYSLVQEWIEKEFAPEFTEKLMESVNGEISNSTEIIAEGVQQWAVNEFAPVIENYITEEFAPEVQNWVCEEFAPEVQNWICEEFAPEVQGWITEEFAPEVQNWITEEFAPVIDNWVNEEFAPEQKNVIVEEVNNNVNAFMESRKQESLSNIDNLLEAIEKKGEVDEALQLLQQKQVDDKYKGVYVVENMPEEYRPRWEMVSEAKKEDIIRRSKMYNFTKPGVLESFWSTINFEEAPITESLEQPVQDTYHNNIFKKMALLRKGF
jgi:hypothetical protein